MKREDLDELHYICPIVNVASIMQNGILSHNRAMRVNHESVAKQEIQDRRKGKRVPGGLLLHDYVNLYFCSRNPMMYLRHDQHLGLCVLMVSPSVLDLPGAVATDQNAASDYVRFKPALAGLVDIDKERVFADSWKHPDDQKEEWRHKSAMCAEVLVPGRVDQQLINGGYVSCEESRAKLQRIAPTLPTRLNPRLFFSLTEVLHGTGSHWQYF